MKPKRIIEKIPTAKDVDRLQEELKVPKVISQILVQRGISSFEDAKRFFRPQITELHDPFLMHDMQKALDRLLVALQRNQKILVYGDYDVDGSTSVALMASFLKRLNARVHTYQPDRYTEGYGISNQGIEYAIKENIELIIALDCGTKAIDKIKHAADNNIDVIVCDHHNPGSELPVAHAILNPKKSDCRYPFKELCGCGIGFKLIQAFAIQQGWPFSEIESYLDLVCIAIGADIVPIIGENRILAFYGLKQINNNPRLSLKMLLGADDQYTSNFSITDLVFKAAPKINAAGRIKHARAAVELLMCEDENIAELWLNDINQFNDDRRDLDQGITGEALMMVATSKESQNKKSTVVWKEDWHKGVVGIVASRLIESYYRPTIVLAIKDGEATGSARSVLGFDVHEAILKCSDLLTKFGGHKYAAGLSLPVEHLEAFSARFESVVSESITEEQLIPKLRIDAEISASDLIPDTKGQPFPKLYRLLEQMAPFGPKNMRPNLLINGLVDSGYSKILKEKHLKLGLKDPATGLIIGGIAFNQSDQYETVKSGLPLSLVCSLSVNEYQGNRELQLDVKDITALD